MSDLDSAIALNALDRAPWGVLILVDDRIAWVNARLADMLYTTPEKLVGLTRTDPTIPAGLVALLETQSERLALSLSEGETRQLRRWRQTLSAGGAEAHYFEDITDQIRREEEHEQLQALVKTLDAKDPETGLLNQNAILHALDIQISRSRRYGNRLSVLRLKLTPPPDIKDPELTLRAISEEFNAQLRWADQIGRLDDSTFLLVLPETSLRDAEELALKLQHERVALASRAEGWTLDRSVTDWRQGDDARKLLQRLYHRPPDRAA
jgi:GGDEF domain-containing protein